MKTTKYSSWLVQTRATNPRWRTAAIWKNWKISVFQQMFDWSPRNVANWRKLIFWTLTAVKSWSYDNTVAELGQSKNDQAPQTPNWCEETTSILLNNSAPLSVFQAPIFVTSGIALHTACHMQTMHTLTGHYTQIVLKTFYVSYF